MTDATYEFPQAIKDALDQETFDVLDFVTGDLTPQDTVKIYTDRAAGWDLNKLVSREKAIEDAAEKDGLSIADEADWVDPEELAAVQARVEAGALTFHLKALAPALKKAINKNLRATHSYKEGGDYNDNAAFFDALTFELMSRTIVKAVRADGKTDATWPIAKLEKLQGVLDEAEFGRLDVAVFSINAEGDLYEAAVSADFLSKR